MGRAKILSGGPDGLYSLELRYSLPGQEAERLKLIARRDKLAQELVEANEALGLRTQEVDQTVLTLDAMIADWLAGKLLDKDPDPPIDPDEPEDPEDPDVETSDLTGAIFSAHNAVRAQYGLSLFGINGALTGAARSHAEWMVRNNVSHTGAGGSTPQSRITGAGYAVGPGAMLGENVAAGQKTAPEVMTGWMNSSPHRANILDPGFTQLGVGYVYNEGSAYRHYFCVTFGRPPN